MWVRLRQVTEENTETLKKAPIVQTSGWVVTSIFLRYVKGPGHPEAGKVNLIH